MDVDLDKLVKHHFVRKVRILNRKDFWDVGCVPPHRPQRLEVTGGGGISRRECFIVGNFVFQMCAKFPLNFQAVVQNKLVSKFSHLGASPPAGVSSIHQ